MKKFLKVSIGLNIAAIAASAIAFGGNFWKLNHYNNEQEQAVFNYSTSQAYQEIREETESILNNEFKHLNETLAQFGEESPEYQQAAANYNQLNAHHSSYEYFMSCLKQNEGYYAPYKAAETSKNWTIAVISLMGITTAINAASLGSNIHNARIEKQLNEAEK